MKYAQAQRKIATLHDKKFKLLIRIAKLDERIETLGRKRHTPKREEMQARAYDKKLDLQYKVSMINETIEYIGRAPLS